MAEKSRIKATYQSFRTLVDHRKLAPSWAQFAGCILSRQTLRIPGCVPNSHRGRVSSSGRHRSEEQAAEVLFPQPVRVSPCH